MAADQEAAAAARILRMPPAVAVAADVSGGFHMSSVGGQKTSESEAAKLAPCQMMSGVPVGIEAQRCGG